MHLQFGHQRLRRLRGPVGLALHALQALGQLILALGIQVRQQRVRAVPQPLAGILPAPEHVGQALALARSSCRMLSAQGWMRKASRRDCSNSCSSWPPIVTALAGAAAISAARRPMRCVSSACRFDASMAAADARVGLAALLRLPGLPQGGGGDGGKGQIERGARAPPAGLRCGERAAWPLGGAWRGRLGARA